MTSLFRNKRFALNLMLQNLPYLICMKTHVIFFFRFSFNFYLMNTQTRAFIIIGKKLKLQEMKNLKKLDWFEVFLQSIKLSANLSFLKSVPDTKKSVFLIKKKNYFFHKINKNFRQKKILEVTVTVMKYPLCHHLLAVSIPSNQYCDVNALKKQLYES